MSAQPGAVLIFNNNTFVILTAMTGKQGGECIIGAFVTDDNNNEAKPIAGIAMAGILVTAALLLSGLSLITSNQQPVIAQQQNMTGGGGVTEGGATITDNTDNTTTDITGSAAQGGNATAIAGGVGGNQSEVRMHIEEARIALQNNDTQGALMQLDLALSTLGGAGGTQGNMTTDTTIAGTDATNTNSEDGIPPVGGTSTADEDNEIADNDAADGNDDESNSNTDANRRETDTEEDSECGGVTVGGTSAADDYGCPPDPDA
jgi:hypothetical protein